MASLLLPFSLTESIVSPSTLDRHADLKQGCTNPGRHVAVATEFYTLTSSIVRPQYDCRFMSPFLGVEFGGGF